MGIKKLKKYKISIICHEKDYAIVFNGMNDVLEMVDNTFPLTLQVEKEEIK